MKHLPLNKNRKARSVASDIFPGQKLPPKIMADSLEVMESYHLQRIESLTAALNNLTIVDHTREIILLCREIKKQKKLLLQIIERKRKSPGNICQKIVFDPCLQITIDPTQLLYHRQLYRGSKDYSAFVISISVPPASPVS